MVYTRTSEAVSGGRKCPEMDNRSPSPSPDRATGQLDHPRPAMTSRARAMIEPTLRAAVDRLPEPVRRIARYHFAWTDEHGMPQSRAGGKAVRPALALLWAEAVGGSADLAVPAAAAVELVHNFSLVHDDIMDRDTLRRHRPAAWAAFGVPRALLTGDAMLVLAFDLLAQTSPAVVLTAMRHFSDTLLKLVDGQSADLSLADRPDTAVTLDETLAMAAGKTSSLIGCACALGALTGGASPEHVQRAHDFGYQLGLAFQLTDDLLGIWGDPAVTGKPALADLQARKKSLPVVAALTTGTPQADHLAELYLSPEPLTSADLETAAELIEQAGGRKWCEAEVDRRLAAALESLDEIDPAPGPRDELHAIARLINHRNH